MYDVHKYLAYQMWNCGETDVQTGRNNGARILMKKCIHYVYKIIPKLR